MNKEEFNGLKPIEQIQYFNEQLKNGLNRQEVNQLIGIGKNRMSEIAKPINYKFNRKQNQYIPAGEDSANNNIKSIPSVPNIQNNDINKSIPSTPNIQNDETGEDSINKITESIPSVPNKSIPNIQSIQNDEEVRINKKTFDELMEMLEWYKEKIKDISREHENIFNDRAITKSFKVYEKVASDFDEYCKRHPQFKKQDLISLAIMEYIKNN